MKTFLKAIAYAVVLMLLVSLALAILAWTKGLFILALVFGVLVYIIYNKLKWQERTMRREDRKW